MGDPVSAGVVGSVIPSLANPITGALTAGLTTAATTGTSPFSLGSILNGIGTNYLAGGDPVKGLAINASALAGSQGLGSGGGSMFGFDPSLGGVGQGISEYFKQTPIFGRQGLIADVGQGASAYNALNQIVNQPAPVARPGQVSRGQIAPMDYMSLLNPQQSTVIRPAMPSLI